MLDKTKYHYTTLDLPNLVAVIDINRHLDSNTYKMHKKISEFAIAAATKFPQWTFYGFARPFNALDDGGYECHVDSFDIYDSREKLGEMWSEYSRGGDTYKVDSPRIEKARERGRGTGSKDMKKVLKTMSKMLSTKTLAERVFEARQTVAEVIDQNQYQARSNYDRTFSGLIGNLFNHVADNLDTYIPIAVAAGADRAALEKIPEQRENREITKEIHQCFKKGNGALVMIHGSDYAVNEIVNGESVLKIFSTDTLPEWLKRGVGMLKLVEVKDSISGIGCRGEENAYFVIKKADV